MKQKLRIQNPDYNLEFKIQNNIKAGCFCCCSITSARNPLQRKSTASF